MLAQSLQTLKTRMELAVSVENFEEAAAIRDEMRALVENNNAEVHPQ